MKNIYQEARLILPLPAETATPAEIRAHVHVCEEIEARLCEAFGGFTATVGRGAWRDDAGRIVADAVTVYDIACPAFAPAFDVSGIVSHETERAWLGAMSTLRAIATDACHALCQSCVYLRCPSGEVLLIGAYGGNVNADATGPSYIHSAEYWRSRSHRGA